MSGAQAERWRLDAAGTLNAARQVPSPNCDERPPGAEIELLVIHNISLPPGQFGGPGIVSAVQGWSLSPGDNHGFLLKAVALDELPSLDNRKVLCGKGFPLETSTFLGTPEAESHRPVLRVEVVLPSGSSEPPAGPPGAAGRRRVLGERPDEGAPDTSIPVPEGVPR